MTTVPNCKIAYYDNESFIVGIHFDVHVHGASDRTEVVTVQYNDASYHIGFMGKHGDVF